MQLDRTAGDQCRKTIGTQRVLELACHVPFGAEVVAFVPGFGGEHQTHIPCGQVGFQRKQFQGVVAADRGGRVDFGADRLQAFFLRARLGGEQGGRGCQGEQHQRE